MSNRPLVLVALKGHAIADDAPAALENAALDFAIETVSHADDVRAFCATNDVTLLVTSEHIDESAGVSLLESLARPPRTVVLFDSVDNPRRIDVAEHGASDYVLGTDLDLRPFVALVERIVTKERLQERLDAQDIRFEALVENSSDGIYILQRRRFAYVNQRFQDMLGYTEDELKKLDVATDDAVVAPESRAALAERNRRIEAGQPVESRYEFVALRKDRSTFDAQVSISYITFEGEPAALGIMQDITERKQFEKQLVRKNRELALLNDLAQSINDAMGIDEILRVGCRRVHDILRAGAVGLSLVSKDDSTLLLAASEGLTEDLKAALSAVSLDSDTLLAKTVRVGETRQVDDLKADDRITIDAVRDTAFEGALVAPIKAQDHVLGAAFVLSTEGQSLDDDDTDLLVSIGVMLGTAIEKAQLLEKEQEAVRRLHALDAIALAVASSLDLDEIADTVARSVQRMFGPRRVVIAAHEPGEDLFAPLCVLDGETLLDDPPKLSADDTLLGIAFERETPVQLTRHGGGNAFVDQPPPYAVQLFNQGMGVVVAIPAVSDGQVIGGSLLGFEQDEALTPEAMEALATLSTHVAIAMKNAALFAGRNRALDDLRDAQDELVQSEKLRALGEMAAGVAHDFNNVLGSILGRAQLLKAQVRDPGFIKHVDIIEKAATDGAETVRRIQELGRVESTDDFVACELEGILNDVVEITQPRWRDLPRQQGRPVELTFESSGNGCWIRGNPHELREVLINLVHNAVDAMPQGGAIRLSVEPVNMAGRPWAEVRVRDTGQGIPDEVKERIFDPFFTTKGEHGTGLGLSVSFSIIRRHGGEIDVQSRIGSADHGTSFVIQLPLLTDEARARQEAKETRSVQEAPALSVSSVSPRAPVNDAADDTVDESGAHTSGRQNPPLQRKGPPRVLVIDDEENIRDILTDILETDDCEVVSVMDGPGGLRVLDEEFIDVVFTDLGLPGMNGYDVAAAIKEKYPRMPVGLVTGWGATLDRDGLAAKGVDFVINKPFKFDQVLNAVEQATSSGNDG